MRVVTLVRISPAIWTGPILAVLAVLATSYANMPISLPEHYSLALTAAGASAVFLIAPVCAACAAWEGGRLRRAGWFSLPSVRSPLTIAQGAVAPILLVGWAVAVVAIAFKFLHVGAVPAPDLRVVLKTLVIISTHTVLGFAVGLHLPPVVAVPSLLLGDYGWMVLPIALEPLWLRHLNGTWFSCCSLSSELAPHAFGGAVVVALGLGGTALLLLRQRMDLPQVALALVPTLLAFGTGCLLVRDLGPDPVVPRTTPLVCSSGHPRVCIWPEQRERLAEVAAIASEAAQRWRAVGLAVPDEFTEQDSGTRPPSGTATFGFSLAAPRTYIFDSLTYSLLPPVPPCANTRFLGAEAQHYVQAWLADVAGFPREDLDSHFGAGTRHIIERVRSAPLDRQRVWLERNLTALRTCDHEPQLDLPQ